MTSRERLIIRRRSQRRDGWFPAYQSRGILRWIKFGTIGRKP